MKKTEEESRTRKEIAAHERRYGKPPLNVVLDEYIKLKMKLSKLVTTRVIITKILKNATTTHNCNEKLKDCNCYNPKMPEQNCYVIRKSAIKSIKK